MKRRSFITLLGGAAGWPLAARAQQPERMRRIGVLMNLAADDPQGQARVTPMVQRLDELGWNVGRNLQIDIRWAAADATQTRRFAADLVALAPDIIVAPTSAAFEAVRQTTRTVPIVFLNVVDPVGAGFVASLAHPGGNATGFTLFEYGLSAKWLELLKQIAPDVKRVAVVRDPSVGSGIGQLAVIQAAAASFGVEFQPIDVRAPAEIELGVTDFARTPNGGLIVAAAPSMPVHRDLIISLAARYRLPAIYPFRFLVKSGGLISYGPDLIEPYRRAAA